MTTAHLQILQPHPGLLAFYDGRVPGHRFAEGPNWVDDGALSLGIASYALVAGDQAIVYDTHVSLDHARAIRAALQARGVRHIRVVLSHWHLDHVAGNAAFADCEIIATATTLAHLMDHHAGIEAGTYHGEPPIAPLVLPNRVFSGRLVLDLAGTTVELIEANIHSDDAAVIWLPEQRILLAGDTVEDCCTYVGAPGEFAEHLNDLARLADLAPRWILPNHGAADVIAAGGYGPGLLGATAHYIGYLQGLMRNRAALPHPLAEVIEADLALGNLRWFAPYEAIHRQNVARVRAHG